MLHIRVIELVLCVKFGGVSSPALFTAVELVYLVYYYYLQYSMHVGWSCVYISCCSCGLASQLLGDVRFR